MREQQVWARVFGASYHYRKHERIIILKNLRSSNHGDRIKKGLVTTVDEDMGTLVGISPEYNVVETIPKICVMPYPFLPFKVGDTVISTVRIDCQGEHAHRGAYCTIHIGRKGRIVEVEDFGTFHRLLKVKFKNGDMASFEDFEVKKVRKR